MIRKAKYHAWCLKGNVIAAQNILVKDDETVQYDGMTYLKITK